MASFYDTTRVQRHGGRLRIISIGMSLLLVCSGCMQELSTPGSSRPEVTLVPTATLEAPTASATSIQATLPTEIAELATLAPTIPTATTQPSLTPVPSPVVPTSTSLPTLVVPTSLPLSNEARWRAQQLNREVFPAIQSFTTTGSELWWYDPINQQHVVLGSFRSDFLAQARFIVRGIGVEALEVPYQVNISYGLTAISPALVARIKAAGYDEWIETYVLRSSNITSP
jgi:hypothetical protein